MHDGSPQIVFLILSYRGPQQLARLARRLTADQAGSVVIHHDPTGTPIGDALAGVAGVDLVPQPRAVGWGDFTQVEALLASLGWLCETRDFDWVVLLSGQDYPVRPLHELAAHLEQSEFDGFIEGVEAPSPTRAGRLTGRGVDQFSARYFYRYVALRPSRITRRLLQRAWPAPLLRTVPTGELRLGLPRARVPFGPDFRCMRGSDWYTLSFRCVETLLRVARDRPQLMGHFAQTFIPSEAFTHTILHAEPGLRLSGDTQRFTSWQPGAARPDVLRLADFERIVSSNTFLARKFDEAEDADVLDALDEHVASMS